MPAPGTTARSRRVLGEPPWLRAYTLWVFGLVIALLIARWLVDRLFGFLVTVLLSLFLGFAIEPIVDRLARRGWRRSMATLLVYFVIALVAAAFIALVGSLVVNQTSGLITSAPDGLAQISSWLKEHYNINLPTTSGQITKKLSDLAPGLAGGALGFATGLLGVVFQIFTVALLGFYFATDGPRVRRALCSALPPARQLEVLRVWDLAIEKTAGFLYSRVLLAACSSAAHGTFFAIIGLPYALTLAIFVGVVSQFIPTVGTYIAGALPVLVALTVSPQKALIVLLFIIAYQQVENYLISPPLSAHTMELHPAIAFAGVIIGASLFGAAGAFLALPLVATGQAFFSSMITRHDLVESEMFDDVRGASDDSDDSEDSEDAEHEVDTEVDAEMHGSTKRDDVEPD